MILAFSDIVVAPNRNRCPLIFVGLHATMLFGGLMLWVSVRVIVSIVVRVSKVLGS